MFGKIGPVDSVRVMRDMATGRARGFAFVEMASDDDAQRAVDELNQAQLGGRTSRSTKRGPSRRAADSVAVAAASAAVAAVAAAAERQRSGGGGGGGGGRRREPRW